MKFCLSLLLIAFPVFNCFAGGTSDIKPGKYRMLESHVNIREQPDLNARVIGQLQLHDEVEVIGDDRGYGEALDIDGVLQNWYNIKFSGIEGFVWGGYIAVESLVFDIDNNGVLDYAYCRVENSGNTMYSKDIFIYVNDRRIITGAFDTATGIWDGEIIKVNTFSKHTSRSTFPYSGSDNELLISLQGHIYGHEPTPLLFRMGANGIVRQISTDNWYY